MTIQQGDLVTYRNSKVKPDVRVKLMEMLPGGRARVRITSNRHPKYRHGDFRIVSLTSLRKDPA